MKKNIFSLTVLIVGLFFSSNVFASDLKPHDHSIFIVSPISCSGTAIARDKILTSTHCTVENQERIIFNYKYEFFTRDIKEIVSDGNDNSIIVLKGEFTKDFMPVNFSNKNLRQGNNIYFIGNSLQLNYSLRRGYVSGLGIDNKYYDINGYFGDSGSCIIYKDECVAIISAMRGSNDRMMKIMVSNNFKFKKEKLIELDLIKK